MIPIGSIVKVKNMDAMVIGYNTSYSSGYPKLSLMAVPYPKGYTSPDSIKLLDESDITVISSGYCDDHMEKFMETYSEIQHMAERIKETFPKEFEEMLNAGREGQ